MALIVRFFRLLFTNFYLGLTTVFVVWILFFDGNDLITLFGNRLKLSDTQNEIAYYQQKILEIEHEQSRLQGNPEAIERFAREKFLMKKVDEDIFLIQEEENTSVFDRLMR